jgi:nitroreductase
VLSAADRGVWRSLIAAAMRAPSADNRLPLRLVWRDDALEWHAAADAAWDVQAHRPWLAHLACGAALENACLRAATLGRCLETEVAPDARIPTLLARTSLGPALLPQTSAQAGWADAIERRSTNRRFYRRARLPGATLTAIEAAASGVPGVRLLWLDRAELRRPALTALRLAESERFLQPSLHRELFEAVRFDVGWHDTTTAGLPPGALEVESPLRGAFPLLRRPMVARALASVGLHVVLGARAAWAPCALAPHLALLIGEPTADAVAAGRALQRAWLAATVADVAVQPLAAVGASLRQRPEAGWVRPATQHRLQTLLAHLYRSAGLPAQTQTHLFLRMGRAAAPSVVASRQHPDALLPKGLLEPPE